MLLSFFASRYNVYLAINSIQSVINILGRDDHVSKNINHIILNIVNFKKKILQNLFLTTFFL